MKKEFKKMRVQQRRYGFSLLEMLVVVALMTLLLGISTAVLSGMKEKARAAVSRDTAKQFAEAWTRYLQTYGEWPETIESGSDGTKVEATASHLKLLNKKQTFFDTKERERSSGAKSGLRDSWGNMFAIWFDTDYDGQLENPFDSEVIVKAAVVVASPGKDGKYGTKDDIVVY
jgi:prepilin-type N-terminal cleavage/methylation domain-containing protein